MTKDVCIVGSGSSGIAAAKSLWQRGISFDCLELGSGIGGVWRYDNDSGLSPAYRSLHINTSRQRMSFRDFPMPSHYPDFPHHSLILKYFEDFVDHYGFREQIRFETRVCQIEPNADGSWNVTSEHRRRGRTVERYRSVIVANGHHWSPRLPEFDGAFAGQTLHSSEYRTPDSYAGKRVLVVGMGNSGCDIACELSRVAERVYLSTRRGAHVIPKYMFGKPLDRVAPDWMWRYLPFRVFQTLFGLTLRLSRGRLPKFGLPVPNHRILEEHPTISADLLNLLGHGEISIKPNLKRLADDSVEFSDGSREPIDAIVYATGFNIKFPFLTDDVMSTGGNAVRLYRRVVHPEHHNLFFIGLIQPWGSIMPLAEEQSEWVGDLLRGSCGLPPRSAMDEEMESQQTKIARRYTRSPRHTIQVDFFAYLDELRRERSMAARFPKLELPARETHTDSNAA